MTQQVNFDSFDLQTRREIKQSVSLAGFTRVNQFSPSECYECGRYIVTRKDHSEYCRNEED